MRFSTSRTPRGLGSTDGTLPDAGLIMDSSGNLYGTTDGASSSHGNVFEIYPH